MSWVVLSERIAWLPQLNPSSLRGMAATLRRAWRWYLDVVREPVVKSQPNRDYRCGYCGTNVPAFTGLRYNGEVHCSQECADREGYERTW